MIRNIKMKVIAVVMMAALMLATPVAVPFTGNIAVAQAATVKISKTKITLEIAKTTTLQVTGTKSKVSWNSSNKVIATVSSKGVVTAQSAGTTKITAAVNKKKYTCTVTVKPAQNPYQTNAKFQEVQIGGLSFVVPAVYKASGEQQADESYKEVMELPDSNSNLTFIATYTGAEAISYDDVAKSFRTVDADVLQQTFDAAYGEGKAVVSDYATSSYASDNGTKSFVYSYNLTTDNGIGKMDIYNLSIDGYTLQVISLDAEGYDIYIDAEYLIDSLMYVTQ